MNFIALIGIVENLQREEKKVNLNLKIEKPFVELSDESSYDKITVEVDNEIFSKEVNLIESGSVVGIKGRLKTINDNCKIIGERVQVF